MIKLIISIITLLACGAIIYVQVRDENWISACGWGVATLLFAFLFYVRDESAKEITEEIDEEKENQDPS